MNDCVRMSLLNALVVALHGLIWRSAGNCTEESLGCIAIVRRPRSSSHRRHILESKTGSSLNECRMFRHSPSKVSLLHVFG